MVKRKALRNKELRRALLLPDFSAGIYYMQYQSFLTFSKLRVGNSSLTNLLD